jgi:hypothetical protein
MGLTLERARNLRKCGLLSLQSAGRRTVRSKIFWPFSKRASP